MKLVSFVIPCYHSAHTIGTVVEEIRRTMPTLPDYDYEIVLVNDCSPDDTFAVISALAREGFDQILVLYSLSNFLTDPNLILLR